MVFIFYYIEAPKIMIKSMNNTRTIAEDEPQLVIIIPPSKYCMAKDKKCARFIALSTIFCYYLI